MPLNNEYKRYFIILQEDDKGYEMAAGKIPTGYAKIEIKNGKGKLTSYVQNVKPGDKADYRMLLIAPNKKAAVDMGRIMIDASGRGELNVEFDGENVQKTGMNISEFMVAAVQANTATPLSGYTGRDKMQWKNSYNIVNKPADRIDKMQMPIQEVAAPFEMKPVENIVQEIPEIKAEVGEVVGDVKNIIGNLVEGAKDVVENVVEGAKDVVVDVAEDIVEGAKNVVGGIQKGIQNVAEYVVGENEVKPMPAKSMEIPVEMQPAPVMPKPVKPKEMQVEIQPAPVQPKPVKPKEVHVEVQPAPVMPKPVKPKEVQVEIQPAPIQPKPQPAPIPVAPVQPIQMMPQKPLFEIETEINAQFVIETEEVIKKPKYECEMLCPQIDYKNYYYEEESECDCDSDSDSDSDDRDRDKHDCEKHPFYTSPMYRRLEKVIGRLRNFDDFEDDRAREKWFRVEDDIYLLNSATIPFMGAMMPLGYPFMSNECTMMMGRKDYIIGVRYVKVHKDRKVIKEVMFGIPGRRNQQEERYYRMRGFGEFKPHKSKDHGYWVMTVEVRSGEMMMKY